jgi:hypothetical protein
MAAPSSSEVVGAVAIITEDIGAAIEVAMGAVDIGGAATPATIERAATVPVVIDHHTKEADIEQYNLAVVIPAEPGKDVVIGVADGTLPIRRLHR